MNVADILKLKRQGIITIRPGDTVATLCSLLREHRIGAVIVSTDGRSIDGVISERDVAYGLAAQKGQLDAAPVSALMTRTVITCAPSDKIAFVASTMLARNIRHLPVIDGGRLVGMVSMRDVLNQRLAELQEATAQLSTSAIEARRPLQDR